MTAPSIVCRAKAASVESSPATPESVHELGDPEVEDFHVAFLRQEEVFELQVAMNDAFLVGGDEPAADLNAAVDRLLEREGPPLQALTQRLADEQLRDDEGCSVVHTHVVNGEDVWVVEGSGGSSLEIEAPQPVGIGHRQGRHHLECDISSEPGISRPIDLAHAASADLGFDPVPVTNDDARAQRRLNLPHARRVRTLRRSRHDFEPGKPRDRGIADERPRTFVLCEQRFDLAAETVVGTAHVVEERRTRSRAREQAPPRTRRECASSRRPSGSRLRSHVPAKPRTRRRPCPIH